MGFSLGLSISRPRDFCSTLYAPHGVSPTYRFEGLDKRVQAITQRSPDKYYSADSKNLPSQVSSIEGQLKILAAARALSTVVLTVRTDGGTHD